MTDQQQTEAPTAFDAQVNVHMASMHTANISIAMSGDATAAAEAERFKDMINRNALGQTIAWCVALLQLDGGMDHVS